MTAPTDPLQQLAHLSARQRRRLLTEHLTKQQLGLYWESSTIERDAALKRAVRGHFATLGREVESLSLQKALVHGQPARQRKLAAVSA